MLNWLFKKRRAAAAPTPAPPPPAAPPAPARAAEALAAWSDRLAAAQGDDTALLALARDATLLPIKLAAVEALRGEDALKAAEREFRRHDRRVHQRARQRLDAAVSARTSHAKSQALTDAALALAGEPVLPLNRLAQLDRDWQALDPNGITPAQAERFAAARAELDNLLRERDRQRRDAAAAAAGVATNPAPGPVAALAAEGAAAPMADTAAALPADGAAALVPDSAAAPVPDGAATPVPGSAAAPVPDSAATQAANNVAASASAEPLPPPARKSRPRPAAPTAEQLGQIDELLLQAEAALAAGHLAPLQHQLGALDAAVQALAGANLDAPRRERRQALVAEFARLRSWQQWGGARAVDTLVDAAESLAKATAAATNPETPDAPRLQLDAHGAAIRELRLRWQALERQQASAGVAQWRRFDTALQAAYAPVAERQAAQKAERRDNLAAREAMLDALDSAAIEPPPADSQAEHWRAQIRALDRWRADWRALGPLEHTVPRAAVQPLRQRLQRSVDRIEAPLELARAAAAAAREPLIEAALALAQEVAAQPQLRDATARVRELQAHWARQAREVPLAQAIETTLWTRFRAAIDSIFAQREAAAQAAEAEIAAALALREDLIAQLGALGAETPAAELRRALAQVDGLWRQASALPRGAATAAVESRYADACAEVRRRIAGDAARRWQAQCDTLAERLALCAAREAGGPDAAEALQPRWDALGALPPAWDAALARRWLTPADAAADAGALDDRLLRLEAAFDLPSPGQWQAARRDLRLQALKDTLEGRAAATPEPAQRSAWLVEVLAAAGADAGQRERLHAIVAALARMPPATLDLAPPPR